MSDMKKYYEETVRPELMKKLGLTNVMQIPKLQKIVISTGIGTKMDKDAFTEARTHWKICGMSCGCNLVL